MSPLRVLAVIKTLDRGGAETLLADAVERLDRDSFTVTVARILDDADGLTPRFGRAGVPVVNLGARSGTDPRWVWRLARLLREVPFDVIHTHSPIAAPAARLLAPAATPVVHTEHSAWDLLHPLTRWSNALTYPGADEVVAVSHAVAATIRPPSLLAAASWPTVGVVHHGIDPAGRPSGPAARAAARATLGLGQDEEVVGCVANFAPKKGHDVLVDAFAALRARRPSLRLVLVGFGPSEQEVRAHVRRRGVADATLFTGDRDDVADLLPAFDVFALASRHEGFGLVVLEAMAAGVPVVATTVDGLPEAVGSDAAGRLVAPGDADALAEAIEEVLADPAAAAQQVEAGAARVEQIRPEAAVDRLAELYHRVARSGPAGRGRGVGGTLR